jgi:hypothetical protein
MLRKPEGLLRLEGLGQWKKSNDLIGTWTRDLPACSIAPQPTTLPRAWVINGYKTKRVIFKPEKKHLFLDISSTNIDTFVPSLCQCVETHRIEVFSQLSQQLRIICDFWTLLKEFLNLDVNRFTRQILPNINRSHFFMNIISIESFCSQKEAYKWTLNVVQSSNKVAILTTEISLWTCAYPFAA